MRGSESQSASRGSSSTWRGDKAIREQPIPVTSSEVKLFGCFFGLQIFASLTRSWINDKTYEIVQDVSTIIVASVVSTNK